MRCVVRVAMTHKDEWWYGPCGWEIERLGRDGGGAVDPHECSVR